MNPAFRLYELTEEHFENAIELCSKIYGNNFYTYSEMLEEVRQSTIGGLCCSYVLYDTVKNKLIGLRITSAPGQWDTEGDCSPEDWNVNPGQVCYFHIAAVDEEYRGLGLGSYLLQKSIKVAQEMGAVAGIAHIWIQSPKQSAFKYFTRNGGKLIALWPNKYVKDHSEERPCPNCGPACRCTGAEMIIHFGERT